MSNTNDDPIDTHGLPENDRRAQDHFRRLCADWYAACAKVEAGSAAVDDADDIMRADVKAQDEAARILMITPAVLPWMVWEKWRVLEFYTSGDGEGDWTDNRPVAFLACIKADLMHLGIGYECLSA